MNSDSKFGIEQYSSNLFYRKSIHSTLVFAIFFVIIFFSSFNIFSIWYSVGGFLLNVVFYFIFGTLSLNFTSTHIVFVSLLKKNRMISFHDLSKIKIDSQELSYRYRRGSSHTWDVIIVLYFKDNTSEQLRINNFLSLLNPQAIKEAKRIYQHCVINYTSVVCDYDHKDYQRRGRGILQDL